jgi:FAD/FMN-containing dehydrogenase
VLKILARHADAPVRAFGGKHSWSDVATTDGVALDLRRLSRSPRTGSPMCASARAAGSATCSSGCMRRPTGHFPLGEAEIARLYPDLERFRAHARATDPHGVFRNAFTARVLGLGRNGA